MILNQEMTNNGKSIQKENLSSVLSPAVRKIVQEKKIDVKNIKGTGKNGRIVKGDLVELME